MERTPRHRPQRRFPQARRTILECDLDTCPHCGEPLKPRRPWHSRKTIQTLQGPLFVAGKSKECINPGCLHFRQHYPASRVWLYSLPFSSYGLDVLAYIGWQHEHEHRQLVEIQRALNRQGIAVNERNVGKLYRQFLALLGAGQHTTYRKLEGRLEQQGGVIWAIDALQPQGNGILLYVLYEVLSGQPVAARQSEPLSEQELVAWLQPYREWPFPVLATLSDGENTLVAALKSSWPDIPHQRCQAHFLNNLAEAVLEDDDRLRKQMRQDLGGLPRMPESDPPSRLPPF